MSINSISGEILKVYLNPALYGNKIYCDERINECFGDNCEENPRYIDFINKIKGL